MGSAKARSSSVVVQFHIQHTPLKSGEKLEQNSILVAKDNDIKPKVSSSTLKHVSGQNT